MTTLLLLHGAIGAKDQLQPLAELLKDRYHVHLLNFQGHGGLPMGDHPFSMELFAGDISTYLADNNLAGAHVFGYSMGGYAAMWLARHKPGLISSLITLGTKWEWDETIADREVQMLDPARIREKLPAFAEQLEKRHAPGSWEKLLAHTADFLLSLGKDNPLKDDDFARIRVPCLIARGDKDKMISQEETSRVAGLLPNGKMRVLPDTAHPIEKVDAVLLSTLIIDFIG